jgi:hypothetical protein
MLSELRFEKADDRIQRSSIYQADRCRVHHHIDTAMARLFEKIEVAPPSTRAGWFFAWR